MTEASSFDDLVAGEAGDNDRDEEAHDGRGGPVVVGSSGRHVHAWPLGAASDVRAGASQDQCCAGSQMPDVRSPDRTSFKQLPT